MEAVGMRNDLAMAQRRAARQALVRQRNEPPRLSMGEEIFNAVTHALGAVLAVAAMTLLLCRSHTGLEVMASCFYGISMILMMAMSSIYHALPTGSTIKRIWRRLDYCSIYLLIGGTFAPIFLVYMGGWIGITLFCAQWAIVLSGVTLLAVFGPGKWRPLHFTLYFLIGWSGILFIPEFYRNARMLLWFILAGGLVYTLGMIPFARGRRNDHCIWHLFVLAAASLHWVGIFTQIYA